MSNVYIRSLLVPPMPRNKRIISGNYTVNETKTTENVTTLGGMTAAQIYALFDPIVVLFENLESLQINYDELGYSERCGQYPRLMVWIQDGLTWLPRPEIQPIITTVDDYITTIDYNFDSIYTGRVIITR